MEGLTRTLKISAWRHVHACKPESGTRERGNWESRTSDAGAVRPRKPQGLHERVKKEVGE